MRALFLCQYVPNPPSSGTKIKAHYLLKYLSRHHDLLLVHYYRDNEELLALDGVRELCSSVHSIPLKRSRRSDIVWFSKSLLRPEPFFILRDSSAQMARVLESIIHTENIDIIHVDQLNMAQFVIGYDVPKILDQQNVVSTLLRRMYDQAQVPLKLAIYLDWRKMLAYEGRMCSDHDIVVAVSDIDARELKKLAGDQKQIDVIPIGIDTDKFALTKRDRGAHNIVSVGTMDYPPNVQGIRWFLSEVWPRVSLRNTDVRFKIIGRNPPEDIRMLAKHSYRVDVLGYVDNLDEHLKDAGVWIAPLFVGSGMKLKILAALSYGIPVVTTSIGCEGISVQPGRDLLTADTADGFANAILSVLGSEELSRGLSERGRAWVVNQYDYRHVYRKWDEIYGRLEARP